jgi:hypothetical protein
MGRPYACAPPHQQLPVDIIEKEFDVQIKHVIVAPAAM